MSKLLVALLLVAPGISAAQDSDIPDPTTESILVASGFLDSHPDLRYRLLGLEKYGEQNNVEAFQLFQRAAYYADKPSQAIVGEMLWAGVGAGRDRPRAFAWMSLAAERGYRSFQTKRDGYWKSLSPPEQERALTLLEELRQEYGDTVAEKRIASALRRGRAQMTGSRAGSQANPVQIVIPGYGSIDSSKFYDPKYWDPRQYRDWHDAYWMELRIGRVDVGDVRQIEPEQEPPMPSPSTPPSPDTDTTERRPLGENDH